MPNIILTPNMSLPVPVVGVDPGPDWANNVNASFTILDGHNHSSGSGVNITPSGININIDLPMNGNNLTLIRSSRYQIQDSPLSLGTDLNCTYVSGVDLYYNDGNGNQVRITQSGGVAGSPGSIANLTSPASASYVAGSSTFVWQSAASTPANMDGGSFIFRNITASSNGITISPPNALGSSYSLILPALPGSQSFMTLDASGNMAAPWTVDNSTLAISGSNVIVKPAGITTTQIAAQGVAQSNIYIKSTGTSVSAGNMAVSSSSGNYSNLTTTPSDVVSTTLVTTGRPVSLSLVSVNGTTDVSFNTQGVIITNDGVALLYLMRDGTVIQVVSLGGNGSGQGTYSASVNFFDFPTAASHVYKIQGAVNLGSVGPLRINNMILIAVEVN